MIAKQKEHKQAKEAGECNGDNRYDLADSQVMICAVLMHMQSKMNATHSNAIYHREQNRPNEEHKVLIIPLSDTSSQPRAMVIKPLNASPTKATMNSSWWPIDITFITIFDSCYPTI